MPSAPSKSGNRISQKRDLIGAESNNCYIYIDPSKGNKWYLYFLNKETQHRHRKVLKSDDGRFPTTSDEAYRIALERYVELRTRTDRGEVIRKMSISDMCDEFIKKEEKRVRTIPRAGITPPRLRLIKRQMIHFQNYCTNKEYGAGLPSTKSVHTLRDSVLDNYQIFREATTDQTDPQGKQLPRPQTLNGELSTIKRAFMEVAVAQGFITKQKVPSLPYVRVGRQQIQDTRRQSFSPEEWVQLEMCARYYWTRGISRYDKDGNLLGYEKITRGKNKGQDSKVTITRSNLYKVNNSGVKKASGPKSMRAIHQLDHRRMIYYAARISMDTGIRIGSLEKMKWCHLSDNKSWSKEDRKSWVIITVPAENTKTGRWHEVAAPVKAHFEKLRYITGGKKDDFIFTNRSTGKPFSKRMWSTNLNEMLVESGLATWRPRDNPNATRQIEVKSGKKFSWYSFRHTFITFALNRGVPITTVCNNCDTGIKYVQDHYFHFDARGKETQGALMVGRKYSPKQSLNPDWMKDNLIDDSEDTV